MVESIVKEVDSQGRISIPVKWRRNWKSRKVILIKREDKIEIIPIKPLSPSSLFDSIEISEDVDFSDIHSIKKALLKK